MTTLGLLRHPPSLHFISSTGTPSIKIRLFLWFFVVFKFVANPEIPSSHRVLGEFAGAKAGDAFLEIEACVWDTSTAARVAVIIYNAINLSYYMGT